MAEQAAHNRWVLGSNPSGATIFIHPDLTLLVAAEGVFL